MPEVIENISIREADNGFIVTVSGTTGTGDSKEWLSEDFVFLDSDGMKKKLSELINNM